MRTKTFGLVLVALAAAVGCGGMAEDLCDAECDCEGCSDKEYDHCIANEEANLEVASAYDCDTEYEDLMTCVLDKADCDQDHWGMDSNDCDGEAEDYWDCVDKGSSLDGDSVSSSGGGGGNSCPGYESLCVSCGFGDSASCGAAAANIPASQCDAAIAGLQASCG